LLNSHNQELTLYHVVEIRGQSALQQADQLDPEPSEGTVAVWTLTEGLRLTEAGVNVFEDVIGANSKQQQLDKEV
jgi:hypothetical protein